MKKLFTWFFPREFFSQPIRFRGFVLGLVYMCMVIAQLFSFEKFDEVVAAYDIDGFEVFTGILVVLMPLLEVSALPFLFSMKVSDRLWSYSQWATTATPIIWLAVIILLLLSADTGINSGILGATVAVPTGLGTLALMLLILWEALVVFRRLPRR